MSDEADRERDEDQEGPENTTNNIRVSYGVSELKDVRAGLTVAQIRRNLSSPLNIPSDTEAQVNGQVVKESYVTKPGDRLEFVKLSGSKGKE